MESGSNGNTDECVFVELPAECVSHIISFTTPADACRLSTVCKILNLIADSDDVWDRFLPSDCLSVISTSPAFVPPPSKKALYLALSDHPVIIDHGRKSFQLERKSGKKCYMLSARDLSIIWGQTPDYWKWKNLPDSRFEEVAVLVSVCWLEIHGRIDMHKLSSNTEYGAYLVFKMKEGAYGFTSHPVNVSVTTDEFADDDDDDDHRKSVCLDPRGLHHNFRGLVVKNAEERRDGWLEIEMGRVFVCGVGVNHEAQQVNMTLKEVAFLHWKQGLIIQGIELRPCNMRM